MERSQHSREATIEGAVTISEQPDREQGELARLLRPLTVQRLLDAYWGKVSHHVPGPGDKFAGLFEVPDLARYAVGDINVGRATHQPIPFRAVFSHNGNSGEIYDPPLGMAKSLLDAGMTLMFNNLEQNNPKLKVVSDEFAHRLQLTRRVQIECFLSPDGSGFAWHFDPVHVLVMQVSGSKRWQLGRTPAVVSPPFGAGSGVLKGSGIQTLGRMGLKVTPPDESDLVEYIVNQGDVLYVPPGFWHRAFAMGHSCHLAISARPMTFAHLLRILFTHVAFKHEPWRRDLQRHHWHYKSTGVLSEEFADLLREAQGEATQILTDLPPDALLMILRLLTETSETFAMVQRGVIHEVL
jgi:ribosomal protein L16 Arg81 hydroxylase